MTTAAYIPARGSSVRLPGKNLRPIGGVPMVRRALDVAIEALCAGLFERVVLDTDDMEIARHGDAAGAEVRIRPERLRGTDVRVIDLLRDWLVTDPDQEAPGILLHSERVDLVAVLMATSPLRTLRHLVESRAALRDDVDGVLSLTRFTQDIGYAVSVQSDQCRLVARSPTKRAALRESGKHDGTVAWYRRDALLQLRPEDNVYALRLAPYWVPAMESVDVDTERDFLVAEALCARKGGA